MCGVNTLHKHIIAGVGIGFGSGVERVGELMEAAEREGKFGVEVERGGGEAAEGGGELGAEGELEAELGLAGAAFCHDLGD